MTVNLFEVKVKIALISGANQGLALTFARGLAAAGAIPVLRRCEDAD
jgi:NAD(P)-dependent dehydrogenase (short-subunit alcohol dehydrogenase family)